MRTEPLNVLSKENRSEKLDKSAIFKGAFITKDAPADDKIKDDGLKQMQKDLSEAVEGMGTFMKSYEEDAKVLKALREKVDGLGGEPDAETKSKMEEFGESLAKNMAGLQACEQAVELFKKQMDQPMYGSKGDLEDMDRKNAIELQRRIFVSKGRPAQEFEADLDDLVSLKDYRSAALKMMRGGLDSKAEIMSTFSEAEKKAFDAGGLDSHFFSPEMLGIEVDCEIECAEMLDLYEQVTVSRSTFKHPRIVSYGDAGGYDCDAGCDANPGPEGNITIENGRTHDFRGVFCFNRDMLEEANYDFLNFMMRAAARSHRINRNRALISGDGVREPRGWLTHDCFTKVAAPSANPTHQDLRQFLASAPVEYGDVTATMHQNTFAYFASMVDNNGRFIFGDGMMGFSPDDVRDRIRISNCLPDPTVGGTLGSAAAPFATGSFIMAAGVWDKAFASVSHRPMFMQQHIGGSTAWCVRYQFGAKDGSHVLCCPAARTFQAG